LAGKSPTDESEAAVRAAVSALERKGEVVRVKGEKLSRIEYTDYQAGQLAIRGEGRAWLLSGERGVPDLPIVNGGIGSALDGDLVLVRVEKEKPKRRGVPQRPRQGGSGVEGRGRARGHDGRRDAGGIDGDSDR